MAISTITAEFQCEVEKIWEIVTSLEHYAWRSDLDKIVVTHEKQKSILQKMLLQKNFL